jgi:Trypsin-like peptidase domain
MEDYRSFVPASPDDLIREISSPLILRHLESNELFISGTATIIGRGIAITAAHNIEDFQKNYNTNLSDPTPYELLMYLVVDEGERVLTLKVLKLWSASEFDIAILLLGLPPELAAEHIWKCPKIQLLPPKVGEEIASFGYTKPNIISHDELDAEVEISSYNTTGKVIEIHHQYRDTSRLKFPCFRVDARFDASMSGGPVFNSVGNLCGIICQTMPPFDDISYVSTLWPMLGILIDIDESIPGSLEGQGPLSLLFDTGALHAVDRDSVTTELLEGVPRTQAKYKTSEWDGVALSSE